MAYFPFFVDITGKKGVVVGGGRIAFEKMEKLLSFTPVLEVIAPQFLPEIETLAEKVGEGSDPARVSLHKRDFRDTDVDNAFFVIAASNDRRLNAHISELCQQRGILVNVVDEKEKCSFIFPSLVRKGMLTVAISTEGASPQVSVTLRKKFEAEVPDVMEEILDYLAWLRPIAKERIPDAGQRSAFLKKAACFCLENQRIPGRDEMEQWFQTIPKDQKREL